MKSASTALQYIYSLLHWILETFWSEFVLTQQNPRIYWLWFHQFHIQTQPTVIITTFVAETSDLLARDNLTNEQHLFGQYISNCQFRATASLTIRNHIYRQVLSHTTFGFYKCETNDIYIALYPLPYSWIPEELFKTTIMGARAHLK